MVPELSPQIIHIVNKYNYSAVTEKDLQQQIHNVLLEHYPTVSREHRLDNKSIIDFLINDVGIEVKIKGNAESILRQCERYLESDKINSLILVTRHIHGFPEQINGKPCYVLHLSRNML